MPNRTCNHCGAPIDFAKNARGKWVPTDPGTAQFHRCKLEQKCGDCGHAFQGPPWMDRCSQCWKANKDKTDPNRRGFGNPESARRGGQNGKGEAKARPKTVPRETLPEQDSFFDDIPF